MALNADASGVIRGKFTIPVGIPAGNKRVSLNGAGGQTGAATFSGQGKLERQTFQQQTTITTTHWQSPPPPVATMPNNGVDPLAQTFTMTENMQAAGVDLWFAVAPTTNASIQIRSTSTGFPESQILTEEIVPPSAVNLGGAPTRVIFDNPFTLLADVEYALVIACGDANGEMSVAEIGKFDSVAQKWITDQPYNIGVLLSSSNASTWTAHQDRDLTFRLLAANYTQTSSVVQLGTIAATAVTDLMLMAYADRPDGATDVQYSLTMPDNTTVITVSDGQPIQLAAAITGNVKVSATLKGNAKFSPVLHPGSQLVLGKVAATGDYVTRAIPGGTGVSVKAVYEALVPSGATVTLQYKGPDSGDAWINIPVSASRAVDDGFTEFTHAVTGVNELSVQIKIILNGTTAARPRVRDLRTYVL